MKKDFSQLGIIPSLALGMLGYASGIKLLTLLSSAFDIPLQTSSIGVLDDYKLSIAILAALVPWLVLLIGIKKYGTQEAQSLGWYFFGVSLLLCSLLSGIAIEMLALNAFQRNVKELVPGEQWVFSVRDLHPFRAGLGGLLVASIVLFLAGMWGKKTD